MFVSPTILGEELELLFPCHGGEFEHFGKDHCHLFSFKETNKACLQQAFFHQAFFWPLCWYDNIFFIQNVFFSFNSQLMRRKLFVLNQIIVLYLFEKNVGNGSQTKTISLFCFLYFFIAIVISCHFRFRYKSNIFNVPTMLLLRLLFKQDTCFRFHFIQKLLFCT